MAVTTSAAVRLLRRLLRQISVTEEKVGVIRALCRSVPRSRSGAPHGRWTCPCKYVTALESDLECRMERLTFRTDEWQDTAARLPQGTTVRLPHGMAL